jgi:hypothetical protein
METVKTPTIVKIGAKHKIEYEYRSLLGILGSWKEVRSQQFGEPVIFIEASEPIKKVVVNGVEYKKVNK